MQEVLNVTLCRFIQIFFKCAANHSEQNTHMTQWTLSLSNQNNNSNKKKEFPISNSAYNML